jgi:tripartite-type tricarboxylate transporter receptor subunit TctC
VKSLLAIALCAAASLVAAQGYPNRPVTLLAPFPPGGSTDTAARVIGDKMRGPLGQTVVIENVGGAGGTVAVSRLARATPDGYTIDIGQWDTHVGAIIYPIDFDLQRHFAPIGQMSVNPQLMAGDQGRQDQG